jgi:hypothetical protein
MSAEWLERQAENRDLAELRLLGTMLTRADLAPIALSRTSPDLFRREAHRVVAEALWSLNADGRELTLESLLDRLIGQDRLDHVGTAADVFAVLEYGEGSLRSLDDLLTIERRRQIYAVCTDGARKVTNPDVLPDDVAAEVFGKLRDADRAEERAPLTTDELLDMPQPDWLIEGIFPAGLSVMFGAPKAGKSYLALSMAWALATGRPWFSRNRDRQPAQVLYLAGEGVGDLRLRAESLLEHTDVHPGGRLSWWPVSLQLSSPTDAARLRLEVEKLDAKVVIVDTWARYAGVRDENDAAQTQQAVNALEALTRQGVSVVVVHHASKQGVMRGSSALAGAVEAAVRVEINDVTGQVRMSSEMARRGSGFKDMTLAYRRVGPDSVLTEVAG